MIRTIAATAVLGIALTGCAAEANDTTSAAQSQPPVTAPATGSSEAPDANRDKRSGDAVVPGGYITQADYEKKSGSLQGSDVVLFFNATWCPTCQEADENLSSAQFPDGLTVVSVDYDSNEALRDRYGVTTQHTFVVVDPDGNAVKKFTGASDVTEIQENLA